MPNKTSDNPVTELDLLAERAEGWNTLANMAAECREEIGVLINKIHEVLGAVEHNARGEAANLATQVEMAQMRSRADFQVPSTGE